MVCRVEYSGMVLDGIVEVVDTLKHNVVVYLCDDRRVVDIPIPHLGY